MRSALIKYMVRCLTIFAALFSVLSPETNSQTAPMSVAIRFGDLNTDCYPSCSHPTEWLQQVTAEVLDSAGVPVVASALLFDWAVDFCRGNGLQYNYAAGVGLQQLAVDGNLVKITEDCCPTCDHQAFRIGVRVFLNNEDAIVATPVLVPNIPTTHAILQNFPNPFNARTRIPFELKARSHVRLEVVNLQGRVVAHLVDRSFVPGRHSIEWIPADISSGVYLARLFVTSPGQPSVALTAKMVHGK